jgi:NAD-dependent dihydropyrimidine dehydrogenase PreA subunit
VPAKTAVRKIVRIDEDKCNGCGLCVPACAEGAIRIEDGKARLAADNLCDGLGNCLGHCPQDAITIEERPAEEFDEGAVEAHLAQGGPGAAGLQPRRAGDQPRRAVVPHEGPAHAGHGHAGCPGSMMRMLRKPAPGAAAPGAQAGKPVPRAAGKPVPQAPRPSQLSQWPVQLALVPAAGPMWQDADVLISADCVPFALAGFHEELLAGKSLAIACPKLDDLAPYVDKLATIFSRNPIRSVTVAHMEVPCCTGIVYAVQEALQRAGRGDIPLHDVTVGIEGGILSRT